MKAATRGENGLTFADVALPEPSADEVRIRVRAAALNRADLGMLAGRMHGPHGGTGTVLGLECAGIVDAVGANVAHVSVGDAVMSSARGAFAEYAVADRGRVAKLPREGMGFEQAAALPVALQTMHDAVVTHGRTQAGDGVLVQGASSGVGLMALKIAKKRGAALVVGTSTDAARRALLREHGADLALDSRDADWPAQVLAATGGGGVNVIVDQVAGATMNANMAACAIGARIVNVGRLGGTSAPFDFDLHALKRIEYIGVTFRTRTVDEVREINRLLQADLGEAIAAGELDLPIAERLPFERLADAFALMRANRHFGKVIVTLP